MKCENKISKKEKEKEDDIVEAIFLISRQRTFVKFYDRTSNFHTRNNTASTKKA